LKQSDGDVIDGTSASGFSLKLSIMRVPVQNQICAMTIHNLGPRFHPTLDVK
jgi:hypothetical protein